MKRIIQKPLLVVCLLFSFSACREDLPVLRSESEVVTRPGVHMR